MNIDVEKIERLRLRYKTGMPVRLICMNDVQAPAIGTTGAITGIDDLGTIHVNWKNGSSLGVVLEAGDRIEVIRA
ncbi:MAG: DUF4314 domain-containing protein [Eubacteriales bacterium]|nr:DUF4314 domain-containing protein [Eubacteriales bacterium]